MHAHAHTQIQTPHAEIDIVLTLSTSTTATMTTTSKKKLKRNDFVNDTKEFQLKSFFPKITNVWAFMSSYSTFSISIETLETVKPNKILPEKKANIVVHFLIHTAQRCTGCRTNKQEREQATASERTNRRTREIV